MDASNMLKPALARGELRCIGATTLNEYRKYIEKDAALERRFQPVYVEEPSVEDTISILRGLKERYELHHGVRIKDAALVAAATLSNRYITDRFLPDKAIDLMDEAASRLRMEIDSMPEELDEIERRIRQLEIERQALKKEKDAVVQGAARRTWRRRLAELKERSGGLKIAVAERKGASSTHPRSSRRPRTRSRPRSSRPSGGASWTGWPRSATASWWSKKETRAPGPPAGRRPERPARCSRRRWTKRTWPKSSPSGPASR